MKLLNYTTEIAWSKSVAECVGLLSTSGRVAAIQQDFDGAGNVTAICFRSKTSFGEIVFRLPVDVQRTQAALNVMWKAGKIPRKFATDAIHARNVGWRIVRDWLAAQLSMIEIGLTKVEQVFLPYAQNESGETVFEAMEKTRFNGLLLLSPQPANA